MDSVVRSVNVKLRKGSVADIFKYPQVKGELTELSYEVAARANALGAGFRTGYYNGRGGTQPRYVGERARETRKGSVAIVHPKNYAAMKADYLHNTMLKSI